jgi:hypothetical protein
VSILSATHSQIDPGYYEEPQPDILDDPVRPLPDYSARPDPDCDFRPDADWIAPDEPYEPDPEDDRWDSETTGGGCLPEDLSPEEQAMYAGTLSAFDYWCLYLDPSEGAR